MPTAASITATELYKEIRKFIPNIDRRVVHALRRDGFIKKRPTDRKLYTRKEVEDMKRLMWMYYHPDETFPEDL